ncbi:MAG TPA: Rieske 2Fe-2S domain-containing protein [Thermoleophilaceae bacterium]
MRLLRRIWQLLVAFFLGRRLKQPVQPSGAPPAPAPPFDPSKREVRNSPRAERAVAALLWVGAACAVVFAIRYVVAGRDTQLLGLTIGLCFAFLAAAAVVAGKFVVPQETAVEERDQLLREQEVEEVGQLVDEGAEGISRRKLLGAAGVAAGATVGAALVVPAASIGPAIDHRVSETPWFPGRRLVDAKGKPYRPEDIEIGTFYTALPQDADPDDLGSSLVVVKLPQNTLRLPKGRETWAPQGVLAYSKVCPHAGCAVSLYRYPLYQPTSAKPAFTCPCHYSTFDPAAGGKLLFGPAGRALPQLPLMVDAEGYLAAQRDFPEDVGPSWLLTKRNPKGPAK